MYKKDQPTIVDWLVMLSRIAFAIAAPAITRLLRSVPFILVIAASGITALSILLAEVWP